MEKQQPSPMVIRYFLFIFLLSILLVGRLLWPFLAILVLSYLLAGIFKPVYAFFGRFFSERWASVVTCLLIILLVFLPLVFFVGALSQEAYALYQLGKGANLGVKLKEFIHGSSALVRFRDLLESFGISMAPDGISKVLSDLAKEIGFFLYNQASIWAANVMVFVFQFIIMILVISFLLIDHDRLVDFVLRLSPLPDVQERRLIKKFEEIAWAVLIGNGVCGLLQGVVGGLVFAIFGLGSPVLWGGVMAVLAFLPIFGIGLVLIPTALILAAKGQVMGGVMMFVFYMVLSFSVEYLLKPKMVGTQVKMHTLLVFLAILGGLNVFGFMGIIYGPLIVTAFLTLADIYLTSYDSYVKEGVTIQSQKGTPGQGGDGSA